MSWIDDGWAWVTDHATVLSTVVSAIAAGIVAWFTIRLARATAAMLTIARDQKAELAKAGEIAAEQAAISGSLADIAIQQKEISRQQFLAEYRPKIIVRN